MNSLGLIETFGLIGAIEGLDVALKTANVETIGCEYIGAGIVTVKIVGEVDAVRAAVEAAAIAVDRIGTLRTTHIIAKTAEDMEWMLYNNRPEEKKDIIADNNPQFIKGRRVYKIEELQGMKVLQLRTVARTVTTNLTKKQIKFARKDELIEAILEAEEREG